MGRTESRTREAPSPVGPYSQSVRVGSVVAAAGQAGVDPETERIVGEDVASRTRQALKTGPA